jgi:thiamine-phosphate pyrophosphorylase
METIENLLRYYFITDDGEACISVLEQVDTALAAGATMIQYRNKRFGLEDYGEADSARQACHRLGVPFIVNDNVLLAKAVEAEGAHLGQEDDNPQLARKVLGPGALIGLSVSTLSELENSNLEGCDYVGCGPVFPTDTKADAKSEGGLGLLRSVVQQSILPVVAIGGITATNAGQCFQEGAVGVAVISTISRASDPRKAARDLARACGL